MKPISREAAFTVSRRNLLPALLQEAFVLADSLKGKPGCRLSDLSSLPDEQLARVTPVVNRDYQIFVDDGHVCCRSRKTDASLQLFSMNKENLTVFNMFNGQHRLAEIGERVEQEMGWDPGTGFDHARNLFLNLVGCQVCLPKDPVEPEG